MTDYNDPVVTMAIARRLGLAMAEAEDTFGEIGYRQLQREALADAGVGRTDTMTGEQMFHVAVFLEDAVARA